MYKNCRSDDAVAKIAFEGNVRFYCTKRRERVKGEKSRPIVTFLELDSDHKVYVNVVETEQKMGT